MSRDCGAAAELGQHDVGGGAGLIPGRGVAVSAHRPTGGRSGIRVPCRRLVIDFSETFNV